MAKILLGATGSVAAMRVPLLYRSLLDLGHEVKVVATEPSLYFFDPVELGDALVRDADEWPGAKYTRGDRVLHIELRNWADLFLIAPLDANTLAKLANGLCDNCLTCVWRAWDVSKPVAVAPAMNTHMWEHPATARHLRTIREDFPKLEVIAPIEKALACGDVGIGAMAEVPVIAAVVKWLLNPG
jgi:phosphopantothenoylcysteine decarboxylase